MGSNEPSRFYSPLRYPGGKACIFPFVSRLLYENELIGVSYAEPYAGGAGLALKLLFEEYVSEIYINDLDQFIHAFWNTVLERNVQFCDWLSDVKVNVDSWHYYKQIQSQPEDYSELELAKATFFLNRTNVSGVLKGGIIGGYEQKGKYKIDARFNRDDLLERIERIETLKDRIHVSNDDGLTFISRMNRKQKDVFVYLDPPYYQKGADLYLNFYSKLDHEKLAKKVKLMNKRWMVSYDNHEFILNLYAENHRVIYRLSQSASNRVGDEVLIFPEDLSFADSLNSLKSPTVLR